MVGVAEVRGRGRGHPPRTSRWHVLRARLPLRVHARRRPRCGRCRVQQLVDRRARQRVRAAVASRWHPARGGTAGGRGARSRVSTQPAAAARHRRAGCSGNPGRARHAPRTGDSGSPQRRSAVGVEWNAWRRCTRGHRRTRRLGCRIRWASRAVTGRASRQRAARWPATAPSPTSRRTSGPRTLRRAARHRTRNRRPPRPRGSTWRRDPDRRGAHRTGRHPELRARLTLWRAARHRTRNRRPPRPRGSTWRRDPDRRGAAPHRTSRRALRRAHPLARLTASHKEPKGSTGTAANRPTSPRPARAATPPTSRLAIPARRPTSRPPARPAALPT